MRRCIDYCFRKEKMIGNIFGHFLFFETFLLIYPSNWQNERVPAIAKYLERLIHNE